MKKTKPDGDFVATACVVLLMVFVMVSTITYDLAPSVSGMTGLLIAATALGLLFVSAILQPAKTAPLLAVVVMIAGLTAINHFLVQGQQLNVLLRYLTSLAALFGIHLANVPDLRRILSRIAMLIIGYAAFVAFTGGAYEYAGTLRLLPYWSGVASSSLIVAALTVLIALTPMNRLTRVIWVGLGLTLVIGYGVVTTVLMLALFFAGWWFLRMGWHKFWLYVLGLSAVVAGVFVRDSNSAEGADIASLGVGAIGSGRLDAWFGRLQDFAERDLPFMLVGLGPYSDYQLSELWDWEAKNAHSDLVTTLMEFGIVGLGAVLLVGRILYKRANEVEKLALIAIAFGAAVSNPLLDRPVAAVGWGIALYACRYHAIVRIPRRERTKKPRRQELQLQKVIAATQRRRSERIDSLAHAGPEAPSLDLLRDQGYSDPSSEHNDRQQRVERDEQASQGLRRNAATVPRREALHRPIGAQDA